MLELLQFIKYWDINDGLRREIIEIYKEILNLIKNPKALIAMKTELARHEFHIIIRILEPLRMKEDYIRKTFYGNNNELHSCIDALINILTEDLVKSVPNGRGPNQVI